MSDNVYAQINERSKLIFKKLKIDINAINFIIDWIDTDKTNSQNLMESLEFNKRNID